MRAFVLFSCLFVSFLITAQYNPNRYKKQIFTTTTSNMDVQYGTAPQWVFPYWNEDLKLNVYRPYGDTLTKRPLIIMAHAGGFLNGSKDVDDMVALCDSFAKRGYVTATIAYRKGFNPLDGQSAERAVYRGIQDGKAAVRYFKQFANTYGIDTNYIFFGGMSAGGYIALHVGYMDKETERPASTYGGGTVNNLGCLDCAGNTYVVSSKVRAVLDFWGAVQDTSIIEAGDVPALIMHGINDGTVPYDKGHPFGVPTLPETYGGFPVSIRMNNLGVYNEFINSTSNLHMLDGSDNGTFPSSGPNAFWHDTLIPRTNKFLFNLVKPIPSKLSPDTIYTCRNDAFNANIQPQGTKAHYWLTSSGMNITTDSPNGVFSATQAGTFQLGYVEVNHLLAFSDTLWFTVVVNELPDVQLTADESTICKGESVTLTASGAAAYSWDQGLNPNTVQVVSPAVTTAYTVTGTSDKGCVKTAVLTVTVDDCLAVEDIASQKIILYPNPAQNNFVIEGEQLSGMYASFELMDLTGEVIKTGIISSNSQLIDVSELSDGVYFVNLTGKNQKTIKVEIRR